MAQRDLRVLGVDPGSRTTGWGVVARVEGKLVAAASGVIRTQPDQPMPQRLLVIYAALSAVVREHAPENAAMEEIFVHKSAASALVLGQARGVALLSLASLPLHTYNASTIKKTVSGSGKADKAQVARMVRTLLGLQGEVPADETDALAIALTHHAHTGLAGAQRTALPVRKERRMSARDQWSAIAARAGVRP